MTQQWIYQSPTLQQSSTNSDLMLKQRIMNALADTGYLALQSIRETVADRTAILSGTVETYHLKQLAGSVASNTADFECIDNSIVVI